MIRKKVLFLCSHNSARSQMAEGLLRALGKDAYEAHSAGTEPTCLNPYAAKVMSEIGIDISEYKSKNIDEFAEPRYDYVVTLCNGAKESCPVAAKSGEYLHVDLNDPSKCSGTEDEKLAAFRETRDKIRLWIEKTFLD
jgi:arsenate reductase